MRAAMKLDKKALTKYAENQRVPFEAALKEFVEIPSVSSEPERLPEIRRCAELAAKTIRDFGGKASILETPGNPLVHGRFDVDGNAPTVSARRDAASGRSRRATRRAARRSRG